MSDKEVDIASVVARRQRKKSDVTANGYQMGKHVDTGKRETVKRLPEIWLRDRYKQMSERPYSRWEIVAGVIFLIFLIGRAARIW